MGLIEARLDCVWVIAPAGDRLGTFVKSADTYPNAKPGQDFDRYTKSTG
jgi:hypothetical protein